MGRYVFKLPDVGEGTTEATIAQWRVVAGDRVEEDQPLVDLETDKAIVEIPAPASGTVVSIHGAVGEKVAVGSELAVIETGTSSEAAMAAQVARASAAARYAETAFGIERESELETQVGPDSGTKRRNGNALKASSATALASPAVRQRARQLGIELHTVQGSGAGGRVIHADLDNFLRGVHRDVLRVTQHAAAQKQEVIEERRVLGVRRRIAERMQEAKRRIPHFSYVEEVDVTALEELRLQLNDMHAGTRPKLTPLAFVMRALVRALAGHPEINARFDDEKGIVHRHVAVHIGIATQTANGLMVPVVTNAQARDPWDCAAEVNRLAAVAREGRATRAELSGSTITITSLGALGGIASTPIINYPEVAIVGLNKIAQRPVARSGAMVVRKMMNLSSSFDHRVVDGWNAASFIQDVKRFLEQPAVLFLG
jgi:2-oxoisovalerate dehydrogenase E2 component (dihydrolipoyl transacylase)